MPAARLTLDDWKQIPETSRLRHQMLAGVHYAHASCHTRHQIVLMNLVRAFAEQVKRPNVMLLNMGVVLSRYDAVIRLPADWRRDHHITPARRRA